MMLSGEIIDLTHIARLDDKYSTGGWATSPLGSRTAVAAAGVVMPTMNG